MFRLSELPEHESKSSAEVTPRPDSPISEADAALEARLSEPVLKGTQGLDTAQVVISAFLIAVIGLFAFSNTLNRPFQYMDYAAIAAKPAMHHVATVASAWDAYRLRPLPAITLASNWMLGGGSMPGFAAVNLAIHLANGILVYLLARKIIGKSIPEPIYMTAGLLFVLHPAVTQGVNEISRRSVLMATMFMLLSLLFYLRATSPARDRSYAALAASLAFFVLAWACDVSAWVLPILIAIAESIRPRENGERRVDAQTPYWAVLILLLVAHGVSGGAAARAFTVATGQAHAHQFDAVLRALAWPDALSVAHPPFPAAEGLPYPWLVWMAAGMLALGIARVAGFAILWMGLAFVAPGLFVTGDALDEASLYLPAVGLAVVLPWALSIPMPAPARVAGGLAAAALLMGSGIAAYQRNAAWGDELALWHDADAKCPDCVEPAARLGSAHYLRGERAAENAEKTLQFQQAETLLARAAGLHGTSAQTWYELGMTQARLQREGLGQAAFLTALKSDPSHQAALLQLAAIAESSAAIPSSAAAALDYYARAIDLGPVPAQAGRRYSQLLADIGDLAGSREVLITASATMAGPPRELDEMNRGLALAARLQDQADALAAKDPGDVEAAKLHAQGMLILGKNLRAAYLLEDAIRTHAMDAGLWLLLGVAKAKMDAMKQFLAEWPDPPAGTGNGTPWRELARRCAANGAWPGALLALENEAARDPMRPSPALSLAEIARELGNIPRAANILAQAARDRPGDPAPLLALCDMAIGANQRPAAVQYLAEAEKRGAPPEALRERREKLGIDPNAAQPGERVFIR